MTCCSFIQFINYSVNLITQLSVNIKGLLLSVSVVEDLRVTTGKRLNDFPFTILQNVSVFSPLCASYQKKGRLSELKLTIMKAVCLAAPKSYSMSSWIIFFICVNLLKLQYSGVIHRLWLF